MTDHPLLDLTECAKCGLMFIAKFPNQRYCGPGCYPSNEVIKRRRRHICEHCRKEFLARQNRRRFCSKACAKASHVLLTLRCHECGRSFESMTRRLYCSGACRSKGRRRKTRAARARKGGGR